MTTVKIKGSSGEEYEVDLADVRSLLVPPPPTSPPPPPPPDSIWKVGDRVEVVAQVNVRSTPSPTGSLVGVRNPGALASIIAGPVVATWTYVHLDFDTGIDGWVGVDNLRIYKDTPTSPPPPPTSSAKPGPLNTGPAGAPLTPIGRIVTTRPGQVFENFRCTGGIRVEHNDCTFRNGVVDGAGATYGCDVRLPTAGQADVTGTRFENLEIFNCGDGIYGPRYFATACHIHDCRGDGAKMLRFSTIRRSWIERLGTVPGAHADGIQLSGGDDNVIEENFIDVPDGLMIGGQRYLGNAAIFLGAGAGWPIRRTKILRNWLNGGVYTLQCLGGEDTEIIDNRFGRIFISGPRRIEYGTRTVQRGSVWDDTGVPL